MGFNATHMYRGQHERLRHHAEMMLHATTESAHTLLLARLAGSLKMHLKGEDESLYPHLLTHGSAEVRIKAAQFQMSMSEFSERFDRFYQRWTKEGSIASDPAGYQAELRVIIDSLVRRMDLEDNELYALADRLNAA
ncbi:MAG TPA: hemerythrin domain-containing protein [Candidatus Sulfotelmatobacter sp.]|nr:hemerythrin domain-containing protein [Candidatus Sulfotelmatobacter sp.]